MATAQIAPNNKYAAKKKEQGQERGLYASQFKRKDG